MDIFLIITLIVSCISMCFSAYHLGRTNGYYEGRRDGSQAMFGHMKAREDAVRKIVS